MKSARMCGNLRCNGREATARLSNLWIALCLLALAATTQAQTLAPAPAASPSASPEEETIIPTFETQKLARTYILVINFPTPLDFSDAQALSYTREKIDEAAKSIGRRFRISDETILRHYRNRGIMPFEIAQNLSPQEYENIIDALPAGMMVRPIYVRLYPNGKIAGQIVGYTGKTGRNPDGIIDNHETLWPKTEGR